MTIAKAKLHNQFFLSDNEKHTRVSLKFIPFERKHKLKIIINKIIYIYYNNYYKYINKNINFSSLLIEILKE